jgi:hypothetical protein
MYPEVARGAVAELRVSHIVRWGLDGNTVTLATEVPCTVVALQTEREHNRPPQQSCIC